MLSSSDREKEPGVGAESWRPYTVARCYQLKWVRACPAPDVTWAAKGIWHSFRQLLLFLSEAEVFTSLLILVAYTRPFSQLVANANERAGWFPSWSLSLTLALPAKRKKCVAHYLLFTSRPIHWFRKVFISAWRSQKGYAVNKEAKEYSNILQGMRFKFVSQGYPGWHLGRCLLLEVQRKWLWDCLPIAFWSSPRPEQV